MTRRSPFDYYVKCQCHGVQQQCPSALLLGGQAKDLAQPVEVNGYNYSFLHAVEGTGKPAQNSDGSWVLQAPFTWGSPDTSCAEHHQQTADLLHFKPVYSRICAADRQAILQQRQSEGYSFNAPATVRAGRCQDHAPGLNLGPSLSHATKAAHIANAARTDRFGQRSQAPGRLVEAQMGMQAAVNRRNEAAGLTPAVTPSCFYLQDGTFLVCPWHATALALILLQLLFPFLSRCCCCY